MEKMNKQMKTKWLKALRSGKFKQGTGILQSGDKYCCLGVLNEVCHLNQDPYNSYIAADVALKIGIHDIQEELAFMNDGNGSKFNPRARKMKFTTIANWIEKNL